MKWIRKKDTFQLILNLVQKKSLTLHAIIFRVCVVDMNWSFFLSFVLFLDNSLLSIKLKDDELRTNEKDYLWKVTLHLCRIESNLSIFRFRLICCRPGRKLRACSGRKAPKIAGTWKQYSHRKFFGFFPMIYTNYKTVINDDLSVNLTG